MKRSLSIVLAATLCAVAFAPAMAAGAVTCSSQYTVQPGDNLFRIGVSLNVPWPQIAAANNLSNPSLIFPGEVLCIPGTPAPTATATATGPTLTPSDTPVPSDTPAPSDTPTATATGLPTPTPVPTSVATPTTFVVPTFTIVSVIKDTSVTIQTANFPPNQDFSVTMGPLGTLGVGGVLVTTTNSGAGGAFTVTYPIPAQLAGTLQIAIRLQSASGYYSYNWFFDATAP